MNGYRYFLTCAVGAAVSTAGLATAAPSADASLEALRGALAENPNDAETMMRLGLYLVQQGQFDQGQVWMERATDIDPNLSHDFVLDDVGPDGMIVTGGNQGTVCDQPVGPDVIVGVLPNVSQYGPTNGIKGYAIGTTSCNIGNQNLLWIAGNNQHPVIGQNFFRLMNDRIEQVGMSWLKHGFTALTLNDCGCGCSGVGGSVLGVGCSDPYSSGLNAQQSNLGPRYQVNAANGVFQYPWNTGAPPVTSNVSRRGQIKVTELDEGLANNALWFVEGHYVTPDDAANGNAWNNASYRRATVSAGYFIGLTGLTIREKPAIWAWQDNVGGVTMTRVDINEPSGPAGTVWVASKAIQEEPGLWRYEYAVQNLNSHESIQAFAVDVTGVNVTQTGFHDVDYHSGDGNGWNTYDGTDWPAAITTGSTNMLRWATQTMTQNVNANALRWGSLYNFRFWSTNAPTTGTVNMTTFRNGLSVGAGAVVPFGVTCDEDLDGDGEVGGSDLAILLGQWGASGGPADIDNSGTVDGGDLAILLGAWGAC